MRKVRSILNLGATRSLIITFYLHKLRVFAHSFNGRIKTRHSRRHFIFGFDALASDEIYWLVVYISPTRSGSRDFNYRDTRDVYREYEKANVRNIHFISVKNMAHTLPSAKYFNETLTFLDNWSVPG